jgi:hypothetical protein
VFVGGHLFAHEGRSAGRQRAGRPAERRRPAPTALCAVRRWLRSPALGANGPCR